MWRKRQIMSLAGNNNNNDQMLLVGGGLLLCLCMCSSLSGVVYWQNWLCSTNDSLGYSCSGTEDTGGGTGDTTGTGGDATGDSGGDTTDTTGDSGDTGGDTSGGGGDGGGDTSGGDGGDGGDSGNNDGGGSGNKKSKCSTYKVQVVLDASKKGVLAVGEKSGALYAKVGKTVAVPGISGRKFKVEKCQGCPKCGVKVYANDAKDKKTLSGKVKKKVRFAV